MALELVCSLFERYWNQGIGTEACRRVLVWGLYELNIPRIIGCVGDGNDASRCLVATLGMSPYGKRVDYVSKRREELFAISRSARIGGEPVAK